MNLSTKADAVSADGSGSASASGNAFIWLAGFLLLGILLGMLGSLVITWHYHIDVEPSLIGLHFLCMTAGFVLAAVLASRLSSKVSVKSIGISASTLAFVSLAVLALAAPPTAAWCRMTLLALCGASAGALTRSLFYANQQIFETEPAAAANQAGALFVAGALLATLVMAFTYFGGSIHVQPALLAVVPAAYAVALAFYGSNPSTPAHQEHKDMLRETLKDLRSIATMLFSLLIFCQFACEWALVGWLPLFLIRRLGINPVTAIWGLGLYFFSLMVGRLLSQILLPLVSHRKLLLESVACAMLGYLLLSLTGSTTLALFAAIILGFSHAPIYPLIAERLDHRFSYHPGFYNGTISCALAGAMATPWLLGYVAETLGTGVVMLIPAVASIAVFILSVLIMIESRLMGANEDDAPHGLLASDK